MPWFDELTGQSHSAYGYSTTYDAQPWIKAGLTESQYQDYLKYVGSWQGKAYQDTHGHSMTASDYAHMLGGVAGVDSVGIKDIGTEKYPINDFVGDVMSPFTGGSNVLTGGSNQEVGTSTGGLTTPNISTGNSAIENPVSSPEDLGGFTASQVNSALQAGNAMDAIKELAQYDNAYLEKYLDNLFNVEQMNSAREYDKMMSDTAFSRYVNDIKKAGYNPWIALQNGSGGQASAGGLSHAASSSTSSSSQATSRYNQATKNQTAIITALYNLTSSMASNMTSVLGQIINAIGKK